MVLRGGRVEDVPQILNYYLLRLVVFASKFILSLFDRSDEGVEIFLISLIAQNFALFDLDKHLACAIVSLQEDASLPDESYELNQIILYIVVPTHN